MTLILIFIVATTGVLWWLFRSERQKRIENAERNAPLPAVDPSALLLEERWQRHASPLIPAEIPAEPETPESMATAPKDEEATIDQAQDASTQTVEGSEPLPGFNPSTPSPSFEHWQEQLKALRDAGALDAALTLARAHFPRQHALQQAAVILRQLVRQGIERNHRVVHLLGELYDIALLASLPRGKEQPPLEHFGANSAERYRRLGHARLKLLTKNDLRHLHQLWGEPEHHRDPAAPDAT